MRFRISNRLWITALALCLLPAVPAKPSAKPGPAEPVDINRATVAELQQVPGMTAVWAQRIARFRPYRTKLDLLEEGIVTPAIYRKIRDHVVAHRVEKK